MGFRRSLKARRGQGRRAAGGREPVTDVYWEDTLGREVLEAEENEQGDGMHSRTGHELQATPQLGAST